jgi:hypothetical protein
MARQSIYFDPSTFGWVAHPAGHRWVTSAQAAAGADAAPSSVLAAVVSADATGLTARRYFPLSEEPALFRAFAAVDPTPDGVLEFVDHYGSLTGALAAQAFTDPSQPGLLLAPTRDTYASCREQALAMRRAVALWDLCQRRDVCGLARHVRWTEDAGGEAAIHYDSHPDFRPGQTLAAPGERTQAVIASPQVRPELLAQVSAGDVTLAASLYITQVINEHMKGWVTPRMAWDPKRLRTALQLFPDSLLGALWLQLAEAVGGDKAFRSCKECGRWFELTPQGARKSKFFCSNACRSKAYRDRQGHARQRRAEGASLKEIAAELDSDVATVRKWVARGRG